MRREQGLERDSNAPRNSSIPPAGGGAYPLRDGNHVRPLIDGAPAFRRICEAVDSAQHSVWLTVAFLDRDFEMPDGRGSLFQVLEEAAGRGVDVRALFWSEPDIEQLIAGADHFAANAANFARLRDSAASIRARWDRVPDHCHHQKSWMVDSGHAEEVAFVGGINLDKGSVVDPGHGAHPERATGHSCHDIYVEVRGPASSDVAHNFVQRWNEASERLDSHGAYPDLETADDLGFPMTCAPAAGDVAVQISRSVLPGLYTATDPAPEAQAYDIAKGEMSVLEQYLNAIDHAQSSIYLENQLLLCPKTMMALREALERGVSVVALVPRHTMPEVIAARKHPKAKPVFDLLASLGDFDNFTMAALAANRDSGGYDDIYVHAKFAAVDDAWATIGSTNAMWRSFRGDTEMNASFWNPSIVRSLRCDLLREHLERETDSLDDRDALALYRDIAIANRDRRQRSEPMQGLAFAFHPAEWATPQAAEDPEGSN